MHQLTAHQREMYDNMARAWQAILLKTEKARALTNSEHSCAATSSTISGRSINAARIIITAFEVPTLIRDIERALAEQHSVIISITSTGEATMTRLMARSADEEAISDLDFSTRETSTRLIEDCG